MNKKEPLLVLGGAAAALGLVYLLAGRSSPAAAPVTAADVYPALGNNNSGPVMFTPASAAQTAAPTPVTVPNGATITGPVLNWLSQTFLSGSPAASAAVTQPANVSNGAPATCCGIGGAQKVYGSIGDMFNSTSKTAGSEISPPVLWNGVAGPVDLPAGSGSPSLNDLLSSGGIATAGGQPLFVL